MGVSFEPTKASDSPGRASFKMSVSDKKKRALAQDEDWLIRAFQGFDKDGNGYVSSEELYLVMQKTGSNLKLKDIQKMVQQADSDGDGHINYNEFVKMIKP